MPQIKVNGGIDKKADSGHITLHEQESQRWKKPEENVYFYCNF